ncbi:hypothetical protein LTR66_001956 [Elasticomyces elasticus]|nr:hypothetical protein LTR66_001956 [Elasticomyces elasticus]KAK5011706.1 hypothetical protein LTR28_007562 [Elasticomyces elasticus]
MADLWLSQIRSNPHLQKPEPQAVMCFIHDVIADRLSPLDAASSISCAYEFTVRRNEADLWSLWTIMIDAVDHLCGETATSQRLAGILAHMSRLPDMVDANGNAHRSKSGRKIWRDLPDFSSYFFEQGIDHILIENIESSRHGATVQGAATKLTNANTFAALYLCELDPDGPPNELSSMRKVAQEHFMYTLEVPFDTPERVRRTEHYIAPAAAWIAIAGPRLYQYSRSNADYKDEDVSPWWIGGTYGGVVMWEKRDRFSMERWAFWRDHLREFSQLQTGYEEAMTQAARAAQTMQMIEEAGQK